MQVIDVYILLEISQLLSFCFQCFCLDDVSTILFYMPLVFLVVMRLVIHRGYRNSLVMSLWAMLFVCSIYIFGIVAMYKYDYAVPLLILFC